jgi:hypothetical protein
MNDSKMDPAAFAVVEEEPIKRAPICGILSVVAPFASGVVFYLANKTYKFFYPNDDHSLSGIAFVGLPVIGCLFAGLLLSGISGWRNEKWRHLQWIGLLLNALPIIYSFFQ